MKLDLSFENVNDMPKEQRAALSMLVFPEGYNWEGFFESLEETKKPVEVETLKTRSNSTVKREKTEKTEEPVNTVLKPSNDTEEKPEEQPDKEEKTREKVVKQPKTETKEVKPKTDEDGNPLDPDKDGNPLDPDKASKTRHLGAELDKVLKKYKGTAQGEWHPTEEGYYWDASGKCWTTTVGLRNDIVTQPMDSPTIINLRSCVTEMNREQKAKAKAVLTEYGNGSFATVKREDYKEVYDKLRAILNNED